MKTKLTIVCVMSAMCAVGATQKSTAKKTSFSESELRTLANAAPDVKNGGTLYSVAMATTDNVERRQEYLKASAACLIACGKNDVYKKHVKGKLLNAVEFEDELKDDCQQCSGAGAKERRCYECSGNGQCSRCKGSGQTVHVGFDRQNTVKSCGKCNGNGSCRKCGGEGTLKEKCATCAGTGKAFSKPVAARVFRDSCNAIADNMKFAKETDVAKEDAPHKNEGKELPKANEGKTTREDNADVGKAEKTSFSASELEALANADPDAKTGVRLYSAALAATNDVNRQQGYFRLAAACFIACGKADIYMRRIKGKLLNATEFEGEVKENCKQCGLGAGVKQNRCNDCNGNGRCSRCKTGGGFGSSRRGSGDLIRNATCSKCNNNGNCPKCGGDGYMKGKCVTCEGTGKVFSKTAAVRVFRDSCSLIAYSMNFAATSNKADVGSRVNLNQGLENLKQFRYSVKEVVLVGEAILSAFKISREALYDTPFHYYGSGNELELKKEVQAVVKSAQALSSDIEANKVEIPRGAFNPTDCVEYWHRNTTGIRKQRLFDEIWGKALYSPHLRHDANNNPLGKVLFSKIPNNMVFLVNDVSLVELRGGGNVYRVELAPLVFGEKDYTLGMVWNGRKCQTKRYVELAKRTGFLASRMMSLLVPTSYRNEDVETWRKGDMVTSRGWLNMWTITNAVRIYDNGEEEKIREIEMSGEIVRSLQDYKEMNPRVSL